MREEDDINGPKEIKVPKRENGSQTRPRFEVAIKEHLSRGIEHMPLSTSPAAAAGGGGGRPRPRPRSTRARPHNVDIVSHNNNNGNDS